MSPAFPPFDPGSVWLVGAGPGDPGLLTLLAARGLASAEVVLHDALVAPAILDLASPSARVVPVGKRGGRPSCRQGDITQILIGEARAGRRVLRLKGGDPFVFGRGGEEAAALAEARIPFRIVPGVTAGIGGLAYAGMPATLRGAGSAVALVTGHGSGGDLPPELDWPALAAAAPVLVFYMALGTIEAIAARLLDAGRAPMTPVAIVSDATGPAQCTIVTSLARCGRDAARLRPASPAVIAVGEVVRLRELLADWQQVGPRAETIAAFEGVRARGPERAAG